MKTGLGLWLGVWILVAVGPVADGQPAKPRLTPEQLRRQVEPSLVYLRFWYAPDAVTPADAPSSKLAGYGTGFVVEGPKGEKWIATASHHFWTADPRKKVGSVSYRLPGSDRFAHCATIKLNEKYDLAMLAPHRAYPLTDIPPLEWAPAEPKDGEPLLVVGSPSGLELRPYSGVARLTPVTIAKIADAQLKPLSAYEPMAADLTFIQHDALIAGGFSGSPVVNRDGKVVGLQSSTLRDAAFVGFAVHKKHATEFNWATPSRNLKDPILASADTALALKSAQAVSFKANPATLPPPPKGVEPPPVKIKLGGVDVEAPFVHLGYVEPNAFTVVEKYVQHKEWYFKEEYGGIRLKRLQELLDRVPLARISNPTLGFEVLVPKGYTYSAQATADRNDDRVTHGLLVTFRPNRKVEKLYDWPVSIWVTVEPELFAQARVQFAGKVKSGEFKPSPEEERVPALFAAFRDRWVNATVADVIDPRFTLRDLGIQVWDNPPTTEQEKKNPPKPIYRGNPKAEIFTQKTASSGEWNRSNYFSTSTPLAHNVRFGGRAPLAFVVHYQFDKTKAVAFNSPTGVPSLTDVEYAIIAASVSAR